MFLSFISFLRYDVVNMRTSECWPVRASEINTRSNEFARLIIRIKKYRVQGSCFRSNISETVIEIRVPFSLLARCKSHATKRCNPRLCSCYRFWDIVVANINNFPILLEQLHICRRTSSHGIIKNLEFIYYNSNSCMFPKMLAKIAAKNFKQMYLSSGKHKNKWMCPVMLCQRHSV